MSKNVVIEMDKRGRERLRTILKALDGLSVGGALDVLELARQILLIDSTFHMFKAEEEKIDETTDRVAGRITEELKKLHVYKPLN